jgi:acetoin utilization deacetylase AcuC-like enzyme
MQNLVIYYPTGHQAHFEAGHPERPERIEVVREALETAGWWEQFEKLNPSKLAQDVLAAVHSPAYLENLKLICQRGENLDLDTYTTPASWHLALNAAGGAAAVAAEVWQRNSRERRSGILRGFALSRPPGHHAEYRSGMGFCLINNIAVAAQYLLAGLSPGENKAQRIAIVDLDLHHGNGTQDIFWTRNDVLFISTHQSPLYPGTGMLEEMGEGAGYGYTVNLPFPPATGDQGYRTAMDEIILPTLSRYKPEMILVSLGFDPHWRDPLGHLMLTAGGIGNLIKSLVDWADQNCKSKIMLVMEGGYDSLSVAACGLSSVAALFGEPIPDRIGPPPRPEGLSWQAVVRRAKEIWQL